MLEKNDEKMQDLTTV